MKLRVSDGSRDKEMADDGRRQTKNSLNRVDISLPLVRVMIGWLLLVPHPEAFKASPCLNSSSTEFGFFFFHSNTSN